jgi:hypothetical protein
MFHAKLPQASPLIQPSSHAVLSQARQLPVEDSLSDAGPYVGRPANLKPGTFKTIAPKMM